MNDTQKELTEFSNTLKILYRHVNDSDLNHTFNLLKKYFTNIDSILDSSDVVSQYKSSQYDIVITDIESLNEKSMTTCGMILDINPKQEILVFYEKDKDNNLSELIDLGIRHFVKKPYKDEDFINRLLKILKSIQELKKEKENLECIIKSNGELDRVVESFDTYVIASRTDLRGKITYASKAYQDISGYTKEELVGKSHNLVRHPDMLDETFEDMWATIIQKKIWKGELKNIRKDGTFYWVRASIAPYYDNEGNHIGYSAIRYDITDKKKVEELSKKLENINDDLENQVLVRIKEIYLLNQEIKDTQKEVVMTMGAIGETRSKETGNHVKRVAEYSRILALNYGLDEEESEMLKEVSPMHDIGKIAIPDSILNKDDKLTKEERIVMDTHAFLGYKMLNNSNRPLFKMAATVAYEHHEKYDGTGYPRGLKGDEISIYGRITALADVFDALGSARIYKPAWEDEKIFSMFKDESGKHFDPKLVDIFFNNLDQFLEVRDKFK